MPRTVPKGEVILAVDALGKAAPRRHTEMAKEVGVAGRDLLFVEYETAQSLWLRNPRHREPAVRALVWWGAVLLYTLRASDLQSAQQAVDSDIFLAEALEQFNVASIRQPGRISGRHYRPPKAVAA